MKILSIDTSSKLCGIAILENENIIKEISQNNGLTHSETLMPIIKETLEYLKLTINDIDLIICDKGPGSFTGIRIGVATAKAFSDSLNIQTIGISSLEALAYNVKENGVICSLIDAKNDNVYVSVFENINGNYILRRNCTCEKISDLLDELKLVEYSITFVGDGAVNYKSIITSALPNKCNFIDTNDLSAYNLGLAGLSHYKNEQFDDVTPLYLRKPQAERMLDNKKGT